MAEVYRVYRKGKKSKKIMVVGKYSSKEEANKSMKEWRSNDQYKDYTYSVGKSYED